MSTIKKQAIAVIAGCVFTMAVALIYGMLQDERAEEEIDEDYAF